MLRKVRRDYQIESMAARRIGASAACERRKRVVEAGLTVLVRHAGWSRSLRFDLRMWESRALHRPRHDWAGRLCRRIPTACSLGASFLSPGDWR